MRFASEDRALLLHVLRAAMPAGLLVRGTEQLDHGHNLTAARRNSADLDKWLLLTERMVPDQLRFIRRALQYGSAGPIHAHRSSFADNQGVWHNRILVRKNVYALLEKRRIPWWQLMVELDTQDCH